ncbi:hypothetical protein L596_010271 [Steinernema carpocapsae]|uniref:Uncharacterized protein n=1 Tax=Steinernema carpocapsae TaxID=34508 RepID=A0A4U5PIK5_STECR|nr:hypothetical protein L596_010271 [Steinernema carpocapsae]
MDPLVFHNLVITNVSSMFPPVHYSDMTQARESWDITSGQTNGKRAGSEPNDAPHKRVKTSWLSFGLKIVSYYYEAWVTACCMSVAVTTLLNTITPLIPNRATNWLRGNDREGVTVMNRLVIDRGREDPDLVTIDQNRSRLRRIQDAFKGRFAALRGTPPAETQAERQALPAPEPLERSVVPVALVLFITIRLFNFASVINIVFNMRRPLKRCIGRPRLKDRSHFRNLRILN